jgi:hypothetical protein
VTPPEPVEWEAVDQHRRLSCAMVFVIQVDAAEVSSPAMT